VIGHPKPMHDHWAILNSLWNWVLIFVGFLALTHSILIPALIRRRRRRLLRRMEQTEIIPIETIETPPSNGLIARLRQMIAFYMELSRDSLGIAQTGSVPETPSVVDVYGELLEARHQISLNVAIQDSLHHNRLIEAAQRELENRRADLETAMPDPSYQVFPREIFRSAQSGHVVLEDEHLEFWNPQNTAPGFNQSNLMPSLTDAQRRIMDYATIRPVGETITPDGGIVFMDEVVYSPQDTPITLELMRSDDGRMLGISAVRTAEDSMPRVTTPAPTAAVARTPTAADLVMIDEATDYFASKLVVALNRNQTSEHAHIREIRIRVDELASAWEELSGADDNRFSQIHARITTAQTALLMATGAAMTYMTNATSSRAMPNVQGRGRNVMNPMNRNYLTRDYLRSCLISLCSSYEGFNWDNSSKELTVHTEAITLQSMINGTNYVVPLGRFRVVWHAGHFDGTNAGPGQFKIHALDPGRHAHGYPHIIHPHVSSNGMCPGNATTGVQATLPNALNGGRLIEGFDLVDGLLHNYGPSPFKHLEEWGNHLCPGCNSSVSQNSMVTCFQCNAGHCRECSQHCPDCHRWYCKERCGTYDRTTRTYACPCNHNTVRCNGCEQRFDPNTPTGRMDPVYGYCPRCLYTMTTGVRPTPATANPPAPTAPRPDVLRPQVPLTPTRPVVAAPNPAPSRPPQRPRHGQFDGSFDDMLDGQERIARHNIEVARAMRNDMNPAGGVAPTPIQNAEAVSRAQAMMDDIMAVREVEAPEPNTVEPLPAEDLIARAQETAPTVLDREPVVGNANRYRDRLTGRWVTR
jgi:hypothetical protein